MKRSLSFLLLAGTLFFTSCKKERMDEPAPGPAPVQKKLMQTTFDENWTFTYNADGTLKEMSLPGDYKMQLFYSSGKVQVLTFSQGKKIVDAAYTIVNGKPVKYDWTYLNDQGQPVASYFYTYEYNAKGLLKKMLYNDNSFDENIFDANDNLIKVDHFNEMGVLYSKTEYNYGNQKDLFPQFGYLNSNFMGFLFPALSRMLPVSKKITSLPGNTVTYNGTISYELDANGYAVKGKWHSLMAGSSDYEWTNLFQ